MQIWNVIRVALLRKRKKTKQIYENDKGEMIMKIVSYILTALIASVPILWIDDYAPTNPVWWTVIAVWTLGHLIGWFDGFRERKGKTNER